MKNAISTSLLSLLSAVAIVGCMTPPRDLDTSLARRTEQGR